MKTLVAVLLVLATATASAHVAQTYTRCYFQTGVYHCH